MIEIAEHLRAANSPCVLKISVVLIIVIKLVILYRVSITLVENRIVMVKSQLRYFIKFLAIPVLMAY